MSTVYEPRAINTVAECTICGGTGQRYVVSARELPCKDPARHVHLMDSKPCICKMNELVERKYAYMHPLAVPPQLDRAKIVNDVAKLKPFEQSLKFVGPLDAFLPRLKRVLVRYAFEDKLFHFSNGIEVVQEYYVGQAEGVERRVQDLIYNRDLVVIRFDTSVANKALKQVMLELIGGRAQMHKPTWIWSRSGVERTEEFSEELHQHIQDFRLVNLDRANAARNIASESQDVSNMNSLLSARKGVN